MIRIIGRVMYYYTSTISTQQPEKECEFLKIHILFLFMGYLSAFLILMVKFKN